MMDPKTLAALDAALLPITSADLADWCELRLERRAPQPGESPDQWRITWRSAKYGDRSTEWRPREKFYSQLSLFLGYVRNFVFSGMGRIPLADNPPRPREES